jgi:hypothetical protein
VPTEDAVPATVGSVVLATVARSCPLGTAVVVVADVHVPVLVLVCGTGLDGTVDRDPHPTTPRTHNTRRTGHVAYSLDTPLSAALSRRARWLLAERNLPAWTDCCAVGCRGKSTHNGRSADNSSILHGSPSTGVVVGR